MTETIKLQLQYLTSEGKKRTLSIANPVLDLDEAQIKEAMETISAQEIFEKDDILLYDTVEGARYVTQNVKEVF